MFLKNVNVNVPIKLKLGNDLDGSTLGRTLSVYSYRERDEQDWGPGDLEPTPHPTLIPQGSWR